VASLTLPPKIQSSVAREHLKLTRNRSLLCIHHKFETRYPDRGTQTREGVKMVVWDWRTGRILLVSEPLASATAPIQLKFGIGPQRSVWR
jgi:hypothetical protein